MSETTDASVGDVGLLEAGRELGGGQLWVQPELPAFRYYIVYLGGDQWARIAPPLDGPGCIAAGDGEGRSVFTKAELTAILKRHHYENRGQYYDVTMAEWNEYVASPRATLAATNPNHDSELDRPISPPPTETRG